MLVNDEQYIIKLLRGDLRIEVEVLDGATLKDYLKKWAARRNNVETIREGTAVYSLIDGCTVLVKIYNGGEVSCKNFNECEPYGKSSLTPGDALKLLNEE